MRLIQPEIDYFSEVGEIVSVVEKIKSLGMEVYFDPAGIRISETFGKGVKDPLYKTAAQLRAYLYGLEDGFWHAVRVDKALFTDSKFTDPKPMKNKSGE